MVTSPLLRGLTASGHCSRLLRRPRPWSQAHATRWASSSPVRDEDGEVHGQKSVLVELERVGGGQGVVANFTLNRPRNQNALTSEVIGELTEAFRGIIK